MTKERPPLRDRFESFHEENMHVFGKVYSIALSLRARGFERCGMGMIFERLRWLHFIETTDDEFKLNDNYTAMYARFLTAIDPRFSGFFELRAQRDEYVPPHSLLVVAHAWLADNWTEVSRDNLL